MNVWMLSMNTLKYIANTEYRIQQKSFPVTEFSYSLTNPVIYFNGVKEFGERYKMKCFRTTEWNPEIFVCETLSIPTCNLCITRMPLVCSH